MKKKKKSASALTIAIIAVSFLLIIGLSIAVSLSIGQKSGFGTKSSNQSLQVAESAVEILYQYISDNPRNHLSDFDSACNDGAVTVDTGISGGSVKVHVFADKEGNTRLGCGVWSGDAKLIKSYGEFGETARALELPVSFCVPDRADVVFVVDVSGSVSEPELVELKDGLKSLVSSSDFKMENNDEYLKLSLVTFAEAKKLEISWTGNKADYLNAINSMVVRHGGTDIAEGLSEANNLLRRSYGDRDDTIYPDYIILVSDGMPNIPRLSDGCTDYYWCKNNSETDNLTTQTAQTNAINQINIAKSRGRSIFVAGIDLDSIGTVSSVVNKICGTPDINYFQDVSTGNDCKKLSDDWLGSLASRSSLYKSFSNFETFATEFKDFVELCRR